MRAMNKITVGWRTGLQRLEDRMVERKEKVL